MDPRRAATAVAIPRIVEALRERGFHFVTIQDMAQPCPAGATPVAGTPLAGIAGAVTFGTPLDDCDSPSTPTPNDPHPCRPPERDPALRRERG